MGPPYLDWYSFGLSNEGEKKHIMHTVFAIRLSRANQIIPFQNFQFSDNINRFLKLSKKVTNTFNIHFICILHGYTLTMAPLFNWIIQYDSQWKIILLACMLFKSFTASLIMYCLPILYPAMYQHDKEDIRKVFIDANSLGLELGNDLDSLFNNHTNSRIMQYIWTTSTLCRNFSNAALRPA